MKRFKKLNRNGRKTKIENLHGYLEGRCCILAVAFHREFGEQIVFLLNGERFIHACTRTKDGKFRDARGIVSPKSVAGNVFDLPEGYVVKEVTEEEVFMFTDDAASRFTDAQVAHAIHCAQVAWPDWPWKDSFLKRSHAFLMDMEALSKKHKVYVHGTIPAQPPVLSPLDSDHHLVYCMHEVVIGLHFFLETK